MWEAQKPGIVHFLHIPTQELVYYLTSHLHHRAWTDSTTASPPCLCVLVLTISIVPRLHFSLVNDFCFCSCPYYINPITWALIMTTLYSFLPCLPWYFDSRKLLLFPNLNLSVWVTYVPISALWYTGQNLNDKVYTHLFI